MNSGGARSACSVRRDGFTLVEIVVVLMLIMIVAGTAAPRYSEYRDRIVPQQASGVVGNFVALARSYAIQTRQSITLLVDPVERNAVIRAEGDTIRMLNLGAGGDFELDTLKMDMAGDTITFTARGICSQCGMTGTGAITVSARGVTYLITFNAVGSWKRELQ